MGSDQSPQVQQIDLNALVGRMGPGDLVIAVSLTLLFIFSLVGAWFHIGYNPCANLGSALQSGAGCDQSVTYGSLWDGFGLIPAVLLVGAMLSYVVAKLPQIRLILPLADWQRWIIFATVEIVLFILFWVIGKGTYGGQSGQQVSGAGYTVIPGWALFMSIAVAVLLGVGGLMKRGQVASSASGSARPGPPPPPPDPPAAED